MSKAAHDRRNSDLAKIHIAKQQLAMTDEDYRAMLWARGQVHSSRDLDQAGRASVLDHLERIGFKSALATRPGRRRRPVPAPEKLGLIRRIRAQLISLEHLPDSYADGISRQMYGVALYEWCTPDQLRAITAALSVQQRNRGANER